MYPVAAATGIAIDRAVGEPPVVVHPVARFGQLMQRVESFTYRDSRCAGAAHAAIGVGVAVASAAVLNRLLGRQLATVVAVAMCAAGRMLDDEAMAVATRLDADDLQGARERVQGLVGRNAAELDADGVARAVVETLAENSVDAVTATLLWGAAGGAYGALNHRAINTLDAMVGYRTERYGRFGWASARLDDFVNYLPARVSAVAVAAAAPTRVREVWTAIRRDAPAHPSPNGGVIEAAYAASLGIRLGGVNQYGAIVENRGELGTGPRPRPADIAGAVQLRRRSTTLLATALALLACRA